MTAPAWPLIAGIGFRRSATAPEIEGLIRHALAEAGSAPGALRMIATAEDRAEDPALVAAAATFGLVPTGIAPLHLAACDGRVRTRSARIEALRGVGCLCEAAALAGAGPGGTLAVPRVSGGSVTCALAFGGETRESIGA